MSSDGETRRSGHLFDEPFDGMFLFGVRDNIDCGATRYAHEMVVVPGEPLGQLEPHDAISVVLRGENPCHREHRERSVERREGDRFGEVGLDLGCCAWPFRVGHGLECRSAAAGEPDPLRGETLLDGLFEVLHYRGSVDIVP
jgi:hypothetical protein